MSERSEGFEVRHDHQEARTRTKDGMRAERNGPAERRGRNEGFQFGKSASAMIGSKDAGYKEHAGVGHHHAMQTLVYQGTRSDTVVFWVVDQRRT